MDAFLRPRRLFVSGGSKLTHQAAVLWEEVGRQLAEEDGLVVITGGLSSRLDAPGAVSADKALADGFESGLIQRDVDPAEWIETYHPDRRFEWEGLIRFSKGRLRVLNNRNAQARRFKMVFDADVVTSIEGESGTRSILDVALAIERPVFPVPCGGMVSGDVWAGEKAGILKAFGISEPELLILEDTKLGSLQIEDIKTLAKTVRTCLMRGFTRQCFVIMPFDPGFNSVFDHAICPALDRFRLKPVRTDRDIAHGNLVEAIRYGIQHCYLAIADTTEDRANVMYELGMAHAQSKPVILLRRDGQMGREQPPFDLLTESVIFYDNKDLDLLQIKIEGAIQRITGRSPDVERDIAAL